MAASKDTGRVSDALLDNSEAEAAERAMQQMGVDGKDSRLAWWREARYGMFIHWGLYSQLGGTWKNSKVNASYGEHIMLKAQIPVKEYEKIAEQFNPVKFDARAWVRAAKEAGMKYIVITAKHHDGFAMYDSKVSEFNIVNRSPFGRDPMMELAEACREEGVKLCFYYSHSMDWHHPDSQGNTHDYPNNIGAYDPLEAWIDDEDKRTRYERYLNEKAFPQLEELLTKYGPVGLIWFDCGHKVTDEQGHRFVDFVRELQPDCLINRRVRRDGFGDYGNSGDNQLHIRVNRKDWESIHTMNNSWGYKRDDNNWKPVKSILENMIDVFSQNGNYLLNVGPTGEGEFDENSTRIMNEIGAWMKKNEDSVYGTEGSPIGKPQWGRCTQKGQTLYLHVFDWPKSGELVVQGIRSRVEKVYALADESQKPLSCMRLNDQDIVIDVKGVMVDPSVTVIAVEVEGEMDTSPVRLLLKKDYVNVFGAFDGDIEGSTLRYDTGKKHRDFVTKWSDVNDSIVWRFRTAEPGTYRISIAYAAAESSAGGTFAIEVAGHELSGTVEATGDEYTSLSRDLGTIHFPERGEYELRVKGESISGATLMNLQSVSLTASTEV